MMLRSPHAIGLWLPSLLVCGSLFWTWKTAASSTVEIHPRVQTFVGQYCLDCHSAEKEKGDLNLEDLSFALDDTSTAQYWQDVLDVLNLGEMPPENKPQPTLEEMTQVLEDLTHSLLDARKAMADTGGRPVSRRLNRREYSRFVGDLLGVDVDENLLPDDDTYEGFDTVGASLSLTGFHIDRYLQTARDALTKLQPEQPASPIERTDVTHRGGARRIEEAYQKYKQLYESGEIAHPDLDAETYRRITPTNRRTYKQHYLTAKNLYHNFEKFDEGWVIIDPRAGHSVVIDMADKPAGRYLLRTRIAAAGKNQEKGRYLGLQRRSESEDALNGTMAYSHVRGTMAAPEILEIPIETHGFDTNFVMRCRQPEEPESADFEDYIRPFQPTRKITWYEQGVWVDWVEVIGPISPNKNRYAEIFPQGTTPTASEADAYAQSILQRFGQRAFRGQAPDPADISSTLQFYHLAEENGRDFESAVKEAMAYMMISPRFLYAIEPGGEKITQLDARGLANRLALFLWSGVPDAALLATVSDRSILSDEVLTAQVDRMLKHPRAEAFYDNFMDQWLSLHEIESVAFPEEYKKVTLASAKREPVETYKYLMRENLSLINLIRSDFVVVNALLAEFYGLPDVIGNDYRPVPVPGDSIRGGLLGMTAILGMGGDGEKSLPIKRGAFVAAKIIDRHPPSPPPNVPLIKVDGRQSTRALFEAHSDKASCASCHQRFDSFGFALESFDELGLWRDTELLRWKTVVNNDGTEKLVKLKEPTAVPIETHGVLEDGKTPFANYHEMVELLSAQKGDQFTTGMVKGLIKYGIGRPVSFTDTEMIEQLVSESAQNDYRARDLVKAFVLSRAFRSK